MNVNYENGPQASGTKMDKAAAKMSQIDSDGHAVAQALSDAEDELKKLSGRLSPLIVPMPAMPAMPAGANSLGAPEPARCDLASRLNSYAIRIRDIVNTIRGLSNTVQL